MDFRLTDEQEDLRRAAREFAEKEITKELMEECDREEKYPIELVKKARRLGFSTLKIPEEYGGMSMTLFEECLVTEEFYGVSPGLGNACMSSTFGTELLELFGTEEQKEKYLRWVKDSPGFATTRLGLILGKETLLMLIETGDLVGLDTRLRIYESMFQMTKDPKWAPPKLLVQLVDAAISGIPA